MVKKNGTHSHSNQSILNIQQNFFTINSNIAQKQEIEIKEPKGFEEILIDENSPDIPIDHSCSLFLGEKCQLTDFHIDNGLKFLEQNGCINKNFRIIPNSTIKQYHHKKENIEFNDECFYLSVLHITSVNMKSVFCYESLIWTFFVFIIL